MIYTTFIGCKTFSLFEIYKPFLVIIPAYGGYPSGYSQDIENTMCMYEE